MRRSPHITALCVLALSASAGAAGCERPDDFTDVEALEERLRRDPTRKGWVGMLRALEVRHRAAKLAVAHATAVDEACATAPSVGPMRLVAQLNLRRELGGRTTMAWEERRTLRRDEAGRVRLEIEAEYSTHGSSPGAPVGASSRWWYVDARTLAAGEAGASAFVVYPLEQEHRAWIIDAGDAPLQSLLDAAEAGWAPVDVAADEVDEDEAGEQGARSWRLGGERLRCAAGEVAPGGFHTAFVADATARAGRLDLDGRQRTLEASWDLPDGARIVARYHDRVDELDGPLVAPAGEAVAAERARPWARIEAMMDELVEVGAARRADPAPAPTPTPTPTPTPNDDDVEARDE